MSKFPATTPVIEWLFIDYLAKLGLTVSFLYTLKKSRNDPSLTLKIFVREQLEAKVLPRSFFDKAFDWHPTTQGQNFWHRHALNWADYLQRLRSKLEGI